MHHIQVLSSDFSRDLSHSVKILPDAQGHNDAHGTRAAELPGICNVNLVSHTMGDGTSSVASSRGVSAFPPHARPHGAQLKIPQLCTPKLGVTAVADSMIALAAFSACVDPVTS